ncbi:MAG: exosome complex protein Rrp42 [Crenarchaeota archaeon]|nr:exosome complex protein Rrp42 [Thermoproteota archaeon]MCR8453789.1 exosome complex protein Rrp42 [Thermoproteota archaeon]MCR8462863.1 exosome complex protein Rrp42 [Thermoproteota archaeon]MCR8470973.1 exosome complex protein Rrp42 [Thermoproteota archaeon]MCR8471808.1 exosome complex protein Rrp42 [Thermoproteota archaeon]
MASEFLSSIHREFLSNIEKESIFSHISRGKRLDGRDLLEMRKLELIPNCIEKAEGSCIAKLGKTSVLAGIKISVGPPYPDTPNQGAFVVNMETMPIASPSFELGPPNEIGIEYARVVDRSIRSSNFIKLEDLVVEPEKYVYVMFIDIYPINDHGNLVDAAFYATLGALLTTRIPKVEIGDKGPVILKNETKPLSLNIELMPIQLTYAKILDKIVLDPTHQEELVSGYKLTLAISKNDLVATQKSGAGVLDIDDFLAAVRDLKERSNLIKDLVLKQTLG